MSDSRSSAPNDEVDRRSMLRLIGGTAAGGIAWAIGYGTGPGRNLLDVTRHRVDVPGLPERLEGFRIAHVTDTHFGHFRDIHTDTLEVLRRLEPDLIACTGDLISRSHQRSNFVRFFDALVSIAPHVFTTFGNWERGNDPETLWFRQQRALLDANGATLLVDEHRHLDAGLVVAGADDPVTGFFDRRDLLEPLPASPPSILLIHSPMPLDGPPPPAPFDLCLAGHTHGGQIKVGPYAPVTPAGSGRFVAGHYETAFGPTYVSRGLGTTTVPVRLMCRPERPIFDLHRARNEGDAEHP